MTMERAMEDLTEKMKKTDEKLDDLAVQVGHIESEFFSEDGAEVEVHDLLRSVNELQLKLMQAKYNTLKEKIGAASPARLENPSQN
jgi:predicted RNase H-like nuclease (RuvC/YqgF family)